MYILFSLLHVDMCLVCIQIHRSKPLVWEEVCRFGVGTKGWGIVLLGHSCTIVDLLLSVGEKREERGK